MPNQVLDPNTCPLEGVNCIEASAGTGKTYNIQNLFVRLLAEREMSVAEILVVTFTEAATKELRDRLRAILTQAVTFDPQTGDQRLKDLLHVADPGTDLDHKQRKLAAAARDFDEAGIFTIHGFCQRVLGENAFESGIMFNLELETNPESLIDDIIQDFYRERFYGLGEEDYQLYRNLNIGLQSFREFIQAKQRHASLQVIQENERFEPGALAAVLADLRAAWNRRKVTGQIEQAALNGRNYSLKQVDKAADAIDAILAGKLDDKTLAEAAKLTREALETKQTAKSDTARLTAPFFDRLAGWLAAIATQVNRLRTIHLDLRDYFNREYARRKKDLNIQTFNDLLIKVHNRLKQPDSPLLKAIDKRYKAVIIDEFQDTDTIQWEIFKTAFAGRGKPVFMVGDPKQAIYGFRGGDIFTYKAARNQARHAYTLTTNYRSSPNLVQAANRLFSGVVKPFYDDTIDYIPIQAGRSDADGVLLENGQPDPQPIRIIDFSAADQAFNTDSLRLRCHQETAVHIARLLADGTAKIRTAAGERSVLPGDITILVTRNADAEALKPYLQAFNIPAIVTCAGSVFESPEARMMRLFLRAVLCAGDVSALRGCLATDLFCVDAPTLRGYLNGDRADEFGDWVEFFKEMKRLWDKRSFIEMFNRVGREKGLTARLLGLENGERKLTNVLHLAELIHKQEQKRRMGPHAILAWLKRQEHENGEGEEAEIRLESDSAAVSIMTIHKSKGLEFPIVFCPFLWNRNATHRGSFALFHRQDRQFLDLCNKPENRLAHVAESLQEGMRLAYVAVTRAKFRCYLMCGTTSTNKTSPMDYMFRRNFCLQNLNLPVEGPVSETLEIPPAMRMVPAGVDLHDRDAVARLWYKPESPMELVPPATFAGAIDYTWRVTSFSNLQPGGKSADSAADHDEKDNQTEPEPAREPSGEPTIFNFPAGARTGSCWHEIFETVDFTDDDAAIRERTAHCLRKYKLTAGANEQARQPENLVFKMVRQVLDKDLGGFCFADIRPADRLSELEFNFGLGSGFATRRLREALAGYMRREFGLELGEWDKTLSGGMMNGFIDLVFRREGKYYITDWKSNKLNGRAEDFDEAGIRAEIAHHYYFLQYLIYTVALHRHLRSRLPGYDYDTHFGGVYYIFLRGVNPDNDNGVFFSRPALRLVETLEQILTGQESAARHPRSASSLLEI